MGHRVYRKSNQIRDTGLKGEVVDRESIHAFGEAMLFRLRTLEA